VAESTLLDAQYSMPTDCYNGSQTGWDMPSNRHNPGANHGFAGGHAEHGQWKVPKVFIFWLQRVAPGGIPDWLRIKAGVKQPME
jgi:hypothetical protein